VKIRIYNSPTDEIDLIVKTRLHISSRKREKDMHGRGNWKKIDGIPTTNQKMNKSLRLFPKEGNAAIAT